MLFVSVSIRMAYIIYCRLHFRECRLIKQNDKNLVRELTSFTSYSLIGQMPNILNTQGLNILINLFFGVTANAARGIAHQVEAAIVSFVSNFMVAVKPQITKSYAVNDTVRMFKLICYGSKYSFFLMLFFSIPVIIEAEFILKLWLGEYPKYTVTFLRLSILCHLVSMLGETGYTAIQASGKIKHYTQTITLIALLPLPATLISYLLGGNVFYAYYSYLITYVIVNIVRLFFMKAILGFSPKMFVDNVIYKIGLVALSAFIIPAILSNIIENSICCFFIVLISSIITTTVTIWLLGLDSKERGVFKKYLKCKFST